MLAAYIPGEELPALGLIMVGSWTCTNAPEVPTIMGIEEVCRKSGFSTVKLSAGAAHGCWGASPSTPPPWDSVTQSPRSCLVHNSVPSLGQPGFSDWSPGSLRGLTPLHQSGLTLPQLPGETISDCNQLD